MNTQTRATFFAFLYLGAGLSLVIFRELLSVSYLAVLVIMIAGTYFALSDGTEA